jgi:hypothetical protein
MRNHFLARLVQQYMLFNHLPFWNTALSLGVRGWGKGQRHEVKIGVQGQIPVEAEPPERQELPVMIRGPIKAYSFAYIILLEESRYLLGCKANLTF